jgi:hypothetical protein
MNAAALHHPSLPSRRLCLLGGIGVLAAWMAGCAAVAPPPRTVELSEARLVQLLARRFPVDHRYMELLDVTLSQPRLSLLPEDNRLRTALHYVLGPVVAGTRKVEGELVLTYGLRYEPSDRTLRVKEVQVERFDVPGLPERAARLSRLGSAVTETLLDDAVIHRFSAEDLSAGAGWAYEPGQPQVVPGGLRLRLTPVRR